MILGKLTTLALIGLAMTACLEVAPALPELKEAYVGSIQDDDDLKPVQVDPIIGVLPGPGDEDALPTNAQIEAKPVESGIKLYVVYCASCHKPYDESNKRNIGINAGQILDPYVMNFPKHKDMPWPKDNLQAYGIERALQIPIGSDPAKNGKGIETSEEKAEEVQLPPDEEESKLPSLELPDNNDPPVLGEL